MIDKKALTFKEFLLEVKGFKVGDNVKTIPFLRGKFHPSKGRNGVVKNIKSPKSTPATPIQVEFDDGEFAYFTPLGTVEFSDKVVLHKK
jgi:hypothetical protein